MVTDVENERPVYILCFGSRGTFISKQRIHTLSIHSGLVTRNQPLPEQGRFSLHHQSLVQINILVCHLNVWYSLRISAELYDIAHHPSRSHTKHKINRTETSQPSIKENR